MYFAFFCILLCVLCLTVSADAFDEVSIYVDGEALEASKNAYIENGRTMVPARSIFEKLGAKVEWNGENKTVIATKDNTTVKLIIGSRTLNVNGSLSNMDTEPVIIGGYTFVPARAVSQAFSANVSWIAEKRIVNITTGSTKTLKDFPAVLIPDFGTFDAVCVFENGASVNYILTVPEEQSSQVALDIINLVVKYEDSMTNIGWNKIIPENSAALFETDFRENKKSSCPYEVKFFVNKLESGKYSLCINVTQYIKVYNTVTGETADITESEYILTAKYRDTSTWKKSLGKQVTLYDNANNEISVFDYQAHGYLLRGFTKEEKTVKMYSPDGTVFYVPVNLVPEYRVLGYYTNEQIFMYSTTGEAEYIQSELMQQKISEGWSVEPFKITLHNHNGGSITVNLHEKDEYLSEGWYEELLVPMYYLDGAKMYVEASDIFIYEALGWSQTPVPADNTEPKEEISTDYTTVYITPSGKKYHISQKCAGSGAMPKTYHEVAGKYDPCKTCTNN